MDKNYLLLYILGIVFLIALIIFINIEPINYILIILIGLTMHLTATIHFTKDSGGLDNEKVVK